MGAQQYPQHAPFISQPISLNSPHYQAQPYIPSHPAHLPPPPNVPPPMPPTPGQGYPYHQKYPDQLSQSPSVAMSFPAPPQHMYQTHPYMHQSISPTSSSGPSLHQVYSHSNLSQNIDNTAIVLSASLSSLSLAPSVSSNGLPELTRVTSAGSVHRPASVISKATAPMAKAVMDSKTAEVLTSLPFENMPRCYVVAPPTVASSSSGNYTPFCIQAPCQALGLHDRQKQPSIHFPQHPGYPINNPESMMKTYGTVLQHMANLACLVSGAMESTSGKKLLKHAEKFLKVVKPTTSVPVPRDTLELSTGVDGPSLQIEAFITDHLQLETIAQLMRDITGSNRSEDWTGGLKKIISPGTGRDMWVCDDCFSGLQKGVYQYDELASLDDLIGYPDRSGVKSEAQLLNAVAVDVYSQMIKGQSRIKSAMINIVPTYFELPEHKSAATFLTNQKLMMNLTNSLREAHLTMIEINANQARDSELMEKDNIYLYVRHLFDCFHLEFVKLSGLPFLLREKLPGFLNHAKYLSFDGVLVDNDKAVANMKKLITSNSDMENLSITRAHLTSTGLKVLCSAHRNLRRLTRVDFSRNRIDGEGMQEFANQVMPTSLDIRFIDFSENPNIGTAGCIALLKAIWPSSSHAIKQKSLITLQLSNTGLCDEAARFLSKSMDGPNGVGKLFNVNLSGNQITKPGLFDLMNCVARNGSASNLRKVSLSQHSSAHSFPSAMDQEVIHFFGAHPTVTHLSLSNISLIVVAQIVNLNKSLISFIVDDVVCGTPQDPNHALTAFNSLCQSISSNTTLQDLKIRLPWSFWTLAFQSANPIEQENNWNTAAHYMATLENGIQRNTTLRCFQMRGVTNFEEELKLTASMMPQMSSAISISGGSMGLYGEVVRTEGENRMAELSQNVRRFLERNQVLYYGGKHGVQDKLISQY
ncbi:hypothetical protein BGZ80_004230 [Entomortierella chlamydospora]|uniref:Uncharacterized protein n=1 Tax=Entomortierella chlamydospora TaxID=101097 RepID=A0A9P6T352_9FUNG|nr:hypothetical protein BGZ79_006978 [Entomortierella chlamydospora]KAG0020419.1 hypothetical protein BGZ80_004230 [Entomortierella chlamydospora]